MPHTGRPGGCAPWRSHDRGRRRQPWKRAFHAATSSSWFVTHHTLWESIAFRFRRTLGEGRGRGAPRWSATRTGRVPLHLDMPTPTPTPAASQPPWLNRDAPSVALHGRNACMKRRRTRSDAWFCDQKSSDEHGRTSGPTSAQRGLGGAVASESESRSEALGGALLRCQFQTGGDP